MVFRFTIKLRLLDKIFTRIVRFPVLPCSGMNLSLWVGELGYQDFKVEEVTIVESNVEDETFVATIQLVPPPVDERAKFISSLSQDKAWRRQR